MTNDAAFYFLTCRCLENYAVNSKSVTKAIISMLYVFSLNCTLSRLKLSDRFVIVAKCKIIFWFVTLFAYKVYCALLLSNLFRIIDFLAPMTSLLSSASPSFPWATIPLTKLRVRGFPKSPTPQMVSAQLV